jgi:hypothetical protein
VSRAAASTKHIEGEVLAGRATVAGAGSRVAARVPGPGPVTVFKSQVPESVKFKLCHESNLDLKSTRKSSLRFVTPNKRMLVISHVPSLRVRLRETRTARPGPQAGVIIESRRQLAATPDG